MFVNLDLKYKESTLGNLLEPLKELEILKDVNNPVEISKDVSGADRNPLDFLYSPGGDRNPLDFLYSPSLYPSL